MWEISCNLICVLCKLSLEITVTLSEVYLSTSVDKFHLYLSAILNHTPTKYVITLWNFTFSFNYFKMVSLMFVLKAGYKTIFSSFFVLQLKQALVTGRGFISLTTGYWIVNFVTGFLFLC